MSEQEPAVHVGRKVGGYGHRSVCLGRVVDAADDERLIQLGQSSVRCGLRWNDDDRATRLCRNPSGDAAEGQRLGGAMTAGADEHQIGVLLSGKGEQPGTRIAGLEPGGRVFAHHGASRVGVSILVSSIIAAVLYVGIYAFLTSITG